MSFASSALLYIFVSFFSKDQQEIKLDAHEQNTTNAHAWIWNDRVFVVRKISHVHGLVAFVFVCFASSLCERPMLELISDSTNEHL